MTIRRVALDLTIEGTFFVKGPGPGTGPAHPGLPTCSNLFNLDFTVQDPLPDMFKGVLPPGVCIQEGSASRGFGLTLPPDTWDTMGYGQQVGGTHPTVMISYCWLVRGSLFIELGCPRDFGKGWRGDLGTFMISRPI